MSPQRPIGVTILACLQFFHSGLGLLVSLAILLIEPFRQTLVDAALVAARAAIEASPEVTSPEALSPDFLETFIQVGAAVGIGVALLGIGLGFGLLRLKRWAWFCTLGLQVLQIIGGLQTVAAALGNGALPRSSLYQQIVQLVISGVIVFYLFRPAVRQAFKRPKPDSGAEA
ncbi:MAG: hypothetical protein Fur0042_24560 [Cyanophyceae cyanobacterium]